MEQESDEVSPTVDILRVNRPEGFPSWMGREALASFLHDVMVPYEDREPDVLRGIDYALGAEPGRGGFVVLAAREERLVGALVMLRTGMRGYVPPNLLLFVGVLPELRGLGLGRRLVEAGVAACEGPVKLHVEPDNPARRLYERLGFRSAYLEMRRESP